MIENTQDYPVQLLPFGEADCESELQHLGDDYRRYFFYHTRFNEAALRPEVYLIVGRRGAGKTALSHYFGFQKQFPNSRSIDVDEPKAYQEVLTRLATLASQTREVAIPRMAQIWEFVIWSILFHEFRDHDKRIADADMFGTEAGKPSSLIRTIIRTILDKFTHREAHLADELEDFIGSDTIKEGRRVLLELARTHPVFVAVDTLENYAVHDEAMVRATAALIECGARFRTKYGGSGIYLKLFMMAEVFPFLCEEAIPNTLKHVKDEIYLHWRPRDLMRLLCWRFYRYLRHRGIPLPSGEVKDWEDPREVQAKIWVPFFGETITNGRGRTERTLPYVFRHTQLRPRQLIVLANEIAKRAPDLKAGSVFGEEAIRSGIREAERKLANEVINAYSSVYPNIGMIMEALSGLPMVFRGKELDKRAPATASQWPAGDYSPHKFRQVLSELGIVGRVREMDEAAGYASADFEYASEDRLPLMTTDMCAIHPMFYLKYNVQTEKALRVYPFPEHPDFADLNPKMSRKMPVTTGRRS